MSVSRQDVDHIASLAKLSFTDEEKERLTDELNKVLDYMELLNSLDTTTVEPLTEVVPTSNVLREDTITPGLTREEALLNAPARTEEFFRVPKVINEEARGSTPVMK